VAVGERLQPDQRIVAPRRPGADEQRVDWPFVEPVLCEPIIGLPGKVIALRDRNTRYIETGLSVARSRQMPGHEMHDIATRTAQDHRALQIDVQDKGGVEQQRESPAEPLRLRLLDIVQDGAGGARDLRPRFSLAEPEKFMRRNEDTQIERLARVRGLVPPGRIDALGLQAPYEHVGNLAHVEIAERTAE